MITDAQDNPLRGATPESAELFDHALTAFNLFHGDPIGLADQAHTAAPACAMPLLLKAYIFGLATEPGATAETIRLIDRVKALPLDRRESLHVAALSLLVRGDWTAAAIALDQLHVAHPRDLLGLQAGHLMDFYRGNARSLRDRIARVLPLWPAGLPGRSVLLGMYAFGLEEAAHYAEAEQYGRQAIAAQPKDSWAHHAVAHVLEMQGRLDDGLHWMATRENHWAAEENLLKVHNWWHYALYHLESGDHRRALDIYDAHIRPPEPAIALALADASAMLWRLTLAGVDVGDRWTPLADNWGAHADGGSYPFNDWHAVMAYLATDRHGEVARIIKALRNADTRVDTGRWASQIALPLAEGFAAFWRRDYATATEKLHPVRYLANQFGGSHAQRDIIDLTLAEAAVRGRLGDLAEALAHERLALRPHSPVNLGLLARSRVLKETPGPS